MTQHRALGQLITPRCFSFSARAASLSTCVFRRCRCKSHEPKLPLPLRCQTSARLILQDLSTCRYRVQITSSIRLPLPSPAKPPSNLKALLPALNFAPPLFPTSPRTISRLRTVTRLVERSHLSAMPPCNTTPRLLPHRRNSTESCKWSSFQPRGQCTANQISIPCTCAQCSATLLPPPATTSGVTRAIETNMGVVVELGGGRGGEMIENATIPGGLHGTLGSPRRDAGSCCGGRKNNAVMKGRGLDLKNEGNETILMYHSTVFFWSSP